jgi:tetratricopeptide (TPR) repeat protein
MTSGFSPGKRTGNTAGTPGIPADAQSRYRQATLLQGQGKTEDALHCFRQAIEIAPDYTEALHETGNCLQDLGRHEEASEYYSRALREIGDRLCEIGRYEESAGHYWVAIRRYEEAGRYYQPESAPDPVPEAVPPGKEHDPANVHRNDTESA